MSKLFVCLGAVLGLNCHVLAPAEAQAGQGLERQSELYEELHEALPSEPPAEASEIQPVNTTAFAPGYGDLNFIAPAPGTYQLPVLGSAKNATALDVEGRQREFHQLFAGKYSLLSFMYTRCNDVNGCPLTQLVFNRVKQQVEQSDGLASKLQFISMSFDPLNDTPAALKALTEQGHDHADHQSAHGGSDHAGHSGHAVDSTQLPTTPNKEVQWTYLTTDSFASLDPILADYNQAILRQDNESGGAIAHILRVFLIDPEFKIRNIYSVSFLHPDVIINDLKTLLLEAKTEAGNSLAQSGNTALGDTERPTKLNKIAENRANQNNRIGGVRAGPGDSKADYEGQGYRTNSLSLASRSGSGLALSTLLEKPPLGLPALPIPADNPITAAKVALGKRLFFDRRLSLNNTLSCAMCHIPEQGFSNNELQTPIGLEGRSIRRNAPSLFNIGYSTRLFHDARETSLENQVWQPLTASNEMAMPSIGQVIEKINGIESYRSAFPQAFAGQPANIVTIGQALASYQRTLMSADSPFDRWHYGKQNDAVSESAKRGFTTFMGKGRCHVCHSVGEDSALFMDNQLHNTGLGWQRSMYPLTKVKRVQVAPGQFVTLSDKARAEIKAAPVSDLGFYEVTQEPRDRWRYRTPSLRNVALTAPYMHDGSLHSLEQVIDFYDHGGFSNANQSPLIAPLKLNPQEKNDLLAFLNSLTGSNVKALISDAFATPIGDTIDDH